ncbi:MAG: hypothetical protein MZW92_13935 [Comamonadaceae bacterium]|nr:hypothetical protein [Comamonadaceae bacterium]
MTTQDPRRQQALVVPDKAERVWRFHQNTLEALKELVQAAGLQHPERDQRRRTSCAAPHDREVRLLANLLSSVQPGALLAAAARPGRVAAQRLQAALDRWRGPRPSRRRSLRPSLLDVGLALAFRRLRRPSCLLP